MIPKVIHYCWFGGGEKSNLIKQCINTWKTIMPDYELKEWNEQTFDLNSVPFVHEAYLAKKWAFVADYVRLYALYHCGGMYLDTDVKVLRKFDSFLQYGFFTCQETHPEDFDPKSILADGTRNPQYDYVLGIGLCSAVMGAEKGCNYIKDCLDFYQGIHFQEGQENNLVIVNLIARVLEKYGYRYVTNVEQTLSGNMKIMLPYTFAGMKTLTDESYAIHLYNGSWLESSKSLKHRLRNRFPKIYTLIQNMYYQCKVHPRKTSHN